MKPEHELLLQQASACRQLAMIADPDIAGKLKELASEYEALAQVERKMTFGGRACEESSPELTKPRKN